MKKSLLILATIGTFMVLMDSKLNAQTINDAGAAFNQALKIDSVDHIGAIQKMIEVVDLCDKIGPDADDLKNKSKKAILNWQFKIANELRINKEYGKAILAYNQLIVYADKYYDSDKKDKALEHLPKLYYNKGQEQMKQDSIDAAINSYDKAITLDSIYTKAYFSKGNALKKKGDFDNMQKAMDKAFELGTKTGDTATASKAKDAMGTTFFNRSNKALSAKNYTQAIEFANSSLKYTPGNSSAFMILCISYNAQSKFNLALEAAKNGLEVETKPETQSNFYFHIGESYEGKKEFVNACANYKKVTAGPNIATANYKIKTVLKCN